MIVGDLLVRVRRPVEVDPDRMYMQVTVGSHGSGARLRRRVPGATLDKTALSAVRAGDVVVSKLDAYKGAIAIVPVALDGAVVSRNFEVFEPAPGCAVTVRVLVRAGFGLRNAAEVASRGTTNRRYLDVAAFLAEPVGSDAVRCWRSAEALADRIDMVCGGMFDAARRYADELDEFGWAHVCSGNVEFEPFSGVVEHVWREVDVDPAAMYRRLTVRTWGAGTEVRDVVPGASLPSGKKHSLVQAGDVVVSLVAATSGSFALVDGRTSGCVVKRSYPTFTVSERLLPEFLVAVCSKRGPVLTMVDAAARGTAQRSVSMARLMDVEVPVPPLDVQREVLHIWAAAARLRQMLTDVETFRDAALNSVFDSC